jgi:hypothetical protein
MKLIRLKKDYEHGLAKKTLRAGTMGNVVATRNLGKEGPEVLVKFKGAACPVSFHKSDVEEVKCVCCGEPATHMDPEHDHYVCDVCDSTPVY